MRWGCFAFVLVALGMVSGCAGVVRTPEERANVFRKSVDMDLKQLADDWDTLWLQDRQYRLTRWHVR